MALKPSALLCLDKEVGSHQIDLDAAGLKLLRHLHFASLQPDPRYAEQSSCVTCPDRVDHMTCIVARVHVHRAILPQEVVCKQHTSTHVMHTLLHLTIEQRLLSYTASIFMTCS